MKTKIICLEGITGAGKTTQAKNIANNLNSIKKSYLIINEKQYEPFKQTILDWHKKGANQYFTQKMIKSIAKAREETHKKHFISLLGEIDYLIFDRSLYTSAIYQCDGALGINEIIDLNLNGGVIVPEKGLIFLCLPEVAMERINKRRKQKGHYLLPSMHETLEEIIKRREFYLQLAQQYPELCLIDTTDRTEEETFKEVKKRLEL